MKKKNLMKSLTALVLSVLMVLSLAACGAEPSDGGKDEDKDGYTVAIIKQMDHASLDEIADAIAARLDAIAQEQNVSIRYTITSGQGDQSVLKQLADQAVADQVDAIIPIATTAAQVSAVAAEDSRTPVVYAAISDPDTAKLTGIDYVTGTSDALNTEYILDMMLAPGSRRLQGGAAVLPVRAQLHQAHCRGQGVSGAARHYLCGADCQHQRRGGGRCRRPDLRQGGRRVHPHRQCYHGRRAGHCRRSGQGRHPPLYRG